MANVYSPVVEKMAVHSHLGCPCDGENKEKQYSKKRKSSNNNDSMKSYMSPKLRSNFGKLKELSSLKEDGNESLGSHSVYHRKLAKETAILVIEEVEHMQNAIAELEAMLSDERNETRFNDKNYDLIVPLDFAE